MHSAVICRLALIVLIPFLLVLANCSIAGNRVRTIGAAHPSNTSHPVAPVLRARTDDTQWQEWVCKGAKLHRLMEMTIEEASRELGKPSESTFTRADLTTSGWAKIQQPDFYYLGKFQEQNFQQMCSAIGVTLDTGVGTPNNPVQWTQDEEYLVDNEFLEPTNGWYTNFFNPAEGLIVAWSNRGPKYRLKEEGRGRQPAPPLYQWSDVVGLEWIAQRGGSFTTDPVEAPRYILRANIANDETLDIMDEVYNRHPAFKTIDPPDWPGISVRTDDEFGQTLLGSPNGRGCAWLLIQRKARFGMKKIGGITFWRNQRGLREMLMEVEDVGNAAV